MQQLNEIKLGCLQQAKRDKYAVYKDKEQKQSKKDQAYEEWKTLN